MARQSLFSGDGVFCRTVRGLYANTGANGAGGDTCTIIALQFTAVSMPGLDNQPANNACNVLLSLQCRSAND